MRNNTRRILLAGISAGMLIGASASGASASHYGDGGYGGYSSGSGRASSYINPDTGAATANPDVDPGSNCFQPDQYDKQPFSAAGTATRNVHNDACFLDRNGNKLDGPASFE